MPVREDFDCRRYTAIASAVYDVMRPKCCRCIQWRGAGGLEADTRVIAKAVHYIVWHVLLTRMPGVVPY